jgi:hypothetical protein
LVCDQPFDLVKIFANLDAATPVGVLSGLDDPELLAELWNLVQNSLLGWI